MTEPLTPPDLDLRDFDWMPLQVVRLRDSGIVVVASAEAFRAAVLLWCAAWHQVPAASLPKDEKMLCSLAGFGRDLKAWRSLSADALHGFVECSDGRLYHPVIAEKAIESGSKKKKQGSQTAAATEARRLAKIQRDEAAAEEERQRNVARNVNVTSHVEAPETKRNDVQGRGEERRGEEKTVPEPDQKKRESNSPPKVLKVVGEGEEVAILIDETYQPSDRAIEYAYSLGMKKVDLEAELGKFIKLSVMSRAKSYNPDMSFKLFCDRWLEFKRKGNADWKPAPDPVATEPTVDISTWAIVVEGTLEHTCWNIIRREQGQMPLFLCKQLAADGTIYERAARCPTLFPPGYDEATGERIAPPENEVSAA